MKKIFMLSLMGLLLLAANAWSDTLTLRDGTRIDGSLVSRTANRVTFKNDQGVTHRYSARQLQSLEIASNGQYIQYGQGTLKQRSNGNNGAYPNDGNNSNNGNNGGYGNNSNNGNNGGYGTYGRASRQNQSQQVLPSGTVFVVRTNEEIDSKAASANQTFAAQVDQDVLDGSNNIVVPRGSDAVLVIRSASAGSVITSPDITLDIQSITVAGQRYLVSTADLQEKSNTGIGANKRTAEMVGGGAVLGALIGAVVGHGKGAAIGAAAGAAGGAGVEILVKGKEVRVPAETVLKFMLNQPVSLWATN
jgi:hypothetical protein